MILCEMDGHYVEHEHTCKNCDDGELCRQVTDQNTIDFYYSFPPKYRAGSFISDYIEFCTSDFDIEPEDRMYFLEHEKAESDAKELERERYEKYLADHDPNPGENYGFMDDHNPEEYANDSYSDFEAFLYGW